VDPSIRDFVAKSLPRFAPSMVRRYYSEIRL